MPDPSNLKFLFKNKPETRFEIDKKDNNINKKGAFTQKTTRTKQNNFCRLELNTLQPRNTKEKTINPFVIQL